MTKIAELKKTIKRLEASIRGAQERQSNEKSDFIAQGIYTYEILPYERSLSRARHELRLLTNK